MLENFYPNLLSKARGHTRIASRSTPNSNSFQFDCEAHADLWLTIQNLLILFASPLQEMCSLSDQDAEALTRVFSPDPQSLASHWMDLVRDQTLSLIQVGLNICCICQVWQENTAFAARFCCKEVYAGAGPNLDCLTLQQFPGLRPGRLSMH